MNRLRHITSERGQAFALVAVSIVALTAMGAFVMDAGLWMRTHRATQSTADAAALAGAQKLPHSAWDARALATEYADKNGGGMKDVTFASKTFPADTITVKAERTAPGFLSRVLGMTSVTVDATATARAYNLGSAKYVAPLAVRRDHPMLASGNCPCFGENFTTTIDLETGRPSLGAFKVLNVDGSYGGVGNQTLVDWITNGYDGYMPLGWYYSDPGAKYNPKSFEDALTFRRDTEILFPIYDQVREQGAGYEYRVVGWVGFYVKNYVARGAGGAVTGYFNRVTWEGLAADSAQNFFGATVVKLVS